MPKKSVAPMFKDKAAEDAAFESLMVGVRAWQEQIDARSAVAPGEQAPPPAVSGQRNARISDGWGTDHPDDVFGPLVYNND